MPECSFPQGGLIESALGVVSGSSVNVIVFANSTANTKGAWAEIHASTPYPIEGFWLSLDYGNNTANRDQLIDIGIGASGSEVVLVSNIYGTYDAGSTHLYYIPLSVPAGTRISARSQSNSNRQAGVQIIPNYGSFYNLPTYGRATTYGENTTDTGGVEVDPGGTVHTKGAWVEITASTTYPIKGLTIHTGSKFNGTMVAASWLLDLGVGAAASEVIQIADLSMQSSASETMQPHGGTLSCAIPAGSRIAIRAQSNINNATDRLFDATLIGYD